VKTKQRRLTTILLLCESVSRYYLSHYLHFAHWIFPFPGLPIPQSGTPRRLADMGCLSVHIEPQQLMHHGEFGIAAARSLVR
jgi:hypothetical protein